MSSAALNFRRLATAAALTVLCTAAAQAAPLYSNGTVVDGSGLSILTPPDSTYGWGAQTASGNTVAEDFTVPLGSTWNVHSLSLFSYQTGAAAFTFTSVNWQILEGADVNTGTVIASGNTAATNEGQVGHRVLNTALGNTQRPIFQIGLDITDIELTAGNYWLTWNVGGTLNSGPWAVPTLGGSGNAMQSVSGAAFGPALMGGTQAQTALAFALNGTASNGTVPEPTSLALVLAAGLAAGWSRKAAVRRSAA